jgi:hypothetical protein
LKSQILAEVVSFHMKYCLLSLDKNEAKILKWSQMSLQSI